MPKQPAWIIEALHRRHDRAAFSCGVAQLDAYLHRFAGQYETNGISRHFVACADAGATKILGYYSLSAGSVAFELVPDELKKRLPRYPIPVAHLGRLAVDRSMQGRGLGEDLLIDALARIPRATGVLAVHAVEVVAIDDRAKQFYRRYGFTALADDERHLYLPLSAVRRLGLS